MTISERLDSSDRFAQNMFNNHFTSAALFQKAETVKLGKKNYLWEMTVMHTEGRMNVVQALLQSHIDSPYEDVDHLIGDLQILLKDINNQLTRLMPRHHRGVSLEKVMNDLEKVKQNRAVNTTSTAS